MLALPRVHRLRYFLAMKRLRTGDVQTLLPTTGWVWMASIAICLLAVALVLIPGASTRASADDTQFGSLCSENPGMPGTNSAPCYADDANMDFCTPYIARTRSSVSTHGDG